MIPYYKIELFIAAIIILMGNEILGALVGFTTLLYYGSMLKINVVNKQYEGSWLNYFKSFFKRKLK